MLGISASCYVRTTWNRYLRLRLPCARRVITSILRTSQTAWAEGPSVGRKPSVSRVCWSGVIEPADPCDLKQREHVLRHRSLSSKAGSDPSAAVLRLSKWVFSVLQLNNFPLLQTYFQVRSYLEAVIRCLVGKGQSDCLQENAITVGKTLHWWRQLYTDTLGLVVR